ncbi:hypothetical protein [Thiospirillum jenense]|uniref:Uncharacterized protein n=1 Tax=Thiospirillum jenense TaxID=1653858 RepID=A0A839HCB3_9GAMM|nr:hypothetical protein [Thiospirillum jenense]MBB1126583.1 hypothetical protein [Thiospirillum jenense]
MPQLPTRRGKKIGWLGGWLGSIVWICALALVAFWQGKFIAGLLGLSIFIVSLIAGWWFMPWRHPTTRYWRLLLPLYLLEMVALIWAVWTSGGWQASGLHWSMLAVLLPLLSPFFTLGWRCWTDDERHS